MKDYRLSRSSSWLHARRRQLVAAAACGLGAAMVLLAGCGPVKLIASTNIPPPLVVKVPITVALFVPPEFSTYVHKEERWSTKWFVDLGKAQTEGLSRLMSAMFERVVLVDSINAGTQVPGGVAAILEPNIEEYAFVTPRDAGSPFYAVSIKYRVNVYLPDGKLADSWGFTGYGTSPSQGLSSEGPLSTATALAMRDAGAKLAVEFREQAVVRGLLPESITADSPAAATPAAPGVPPIVAPPAAEESKDGAAPATEAAPTEPANGESPETPKDEQPTAAQEDSTAAQEDNATPPASAPANTDEDAAATEPISEPSTPISEPSTEEPSTSPEAEPPASPPDPETTALTLRPTANR